MKIKKIDIERNIPVITTWQALDNGRTKIHKSWYDQFEVVFGDEAHGAKAATLIKILSNMENTPYRFGTTGTLDNVDINQATIEGLFGPQYKAISTREMIDKGYAAKFQIKCIILRYPEAVCKEFHKIGPTKKHKNYQEEIDFIIHYQKRTNFIKNLALSLDKNKLVFFRLKEHGDLLYQALEGNQNLFYIDGGVKASEREAIRHAIEDEESAILLASLGTTSTGVSINRLHHMIAAAPSKSKIRVLQSIGRMLRLHEEKDEHGAILYDIVDDLSYKGRKNFVLQHFEERIKMYDAEGHPYKIYTVGIK